MGNCAASSGVQVLERASNSIGNYPANLKVLLVSAWALILIAGLLFLFQYHPEDYSFKNLSGK